MQIKIEEAFHKYGTVIVNTHVQVITKRCSRILGYKRVQILNNFSYKQKSNDLPTLA